MKHIYLLAATISLSLQASYQEVATKLLDDVYNAKVHWTKKEDPSTKNVWYKPTSWFAKDQSFEIATHKQALCQEENELISILADKHSPEAALETIKKLQIKHAHDHTLYNKQTHFEKHWMAYTAGVTVAALTAVYLYQFFKNNTLFVLDPNNPSMAQALEAAPFLAGKNFVQKDGKQYLQVPTTQESAAKKFLDINHCTYTQTRPQPSLALYNEQGETKASELVRTNLIEPVRNISKILKGESPSELQVLKADPTVTTQLFESRLEKLISQAATEETTRALVEGQLGTRAVTELSFEEKRNLSDALFCKLSEVAPVQLKQFLTTVSDTQHTVAATTIPQTVDQIKVDLTQLPRIEPLAMPSLPGPIPALPTPELPVLEAPTQFEIPSTQANSNASAKIDPLVTIPWLGHYSLPNSQIINLNATSVAQQGKDLLSSFKNLSETLSTAAKKFEQPGFVPHPSPQLQSTHPPQKGIPLLGLPIISAARDLDNVLIQSNITLKDFSHALHSAETELLPPLTATAIQAGNFLGTANTLTQELGATTVPAINALTKEATATVATINATTLPNVNALLSTVCAAAPQLVKDANALSATAQQIAAQVEKGATQANVLIDKVNTDFIPPLQTIVKDAQNISHTVDTTLTAAKEMASQNANLWSLCTESVLLRAMQRDLQLTAALNEGTRIHEKLKLTTEMLALAPTVLAAAAVYKGTTTAYKKALVDPTLKAIKKDLLALQLLYNQEANSNQVSERYKGLSCYWLTRLKRSLKSIPREFKDSYTAYLQNLERLDQTPAQKMGIVDVMFKEYGFLQSH